MSAAIPRPLAPWAPLLAPMVADAASALDALAARLTLAVGPLPQRTEGDAEPDGYDGLTRRGLYERLLATEWLLATEAPDEFDRRAASGEHLFTQLRRRGGASASKLIVLFDAGPMQLGAPRLAHLAAFAVLSARARAARAAWGFALLGDMPLEASATGGPNESGAGALVALGLRASDSEAGMCVLLDARRVRPSTLEDALVWRQALIERSGRADARDELWLIAAPALAAAAAARGFASIAIDDGETPGERALSVVVSRPPRAPVSLTLPLPPSAACTRLLRDPFGAHRAVDHAALEVRDFAEVVLSIDGRKIFWRGRDGQISYRPVPNSAREPPARPRRLPHANVQADQIVAVGAQGRKVAMLVRHDEALRLHSGRGNEPFGNSAGVGTVAPGAPLGVVFTMTAMRGALLGDGTLLSHRRHGAAGDWTVGVRALALVPDGFVFIAPGSADTRDEARRDADPSMLYLHRRAVHPSGIIDSVVPLGAFGSTTPRALSFGGHLAWTLDDEVWRVGDETRHTALFAPANTQVIGAIDRGNQAQLLLIEGDGRSLVRVGRSEEASLGRAASRIRGVRTAASGDVFALLLEDGGVEIRGPFETVPRLVLRGAAQPTSSELNAAPAAAAEPR